MPDWETFHARLENCTACRLCESRQNIVAGEGDPHAKVMFVGEGPGAQEDAQGRPFVGPAGQLLDRMLDSIGLTREQVYIANVVKCRPPNNRNPLDSEAEACLPFLRYQVALVRPRIIVCLGTVACRFVIDPEARVSRIRGQMIHRGSYTLFATYHPAALLRDEPKKIDAWRDFQMLKRELQAIEAKEETL